MSHKLYLHPLKRDILLGHSRPGLRLPDQTFDIKQAEVIPTWDQANASRPDLLVYKFWQRNLLQMLGMMLTIPKDHVRLHYFCSRNGNGRRNAPDKLGCGSVACLGGWLPSWPYFMVLGLVRSPEYVPTRQLVTPWRGTE